MKSRVVARLFQRMGYFGRCFKAFMKLLKFDSIQAG